VNKETITALAPKSREKTSRYHLTFWNKFTNPSNTK